MDLSIVIVNYNTKDLTAQTIDSVLATSKATDYEIIVVDNSTSAEQCYHSQDKRVKVLKKVENRGFGHACNLGAKEAVGEILLFLNSDTIAGEGAIDKSVSFLQSAENIGALGIRTYLRDGTFDAGCRRGFPTPAASLYYFLGFDKRHPESRKYGAYHQTFLSENETAEVDCVSGAYLMMPRKVFEELGGFDEEFFMYGEDVDLCYRIKEKNYRVIYYAQASILHLKGESGLKAKSKEIVYHFYHAMKLFYRKHYKKKYNVFVTALVYMGIEGKYRLTLLQRKRNK